MTIVKLIIEHVNTEQYFCHPDGELPTVHLLGNKNLVKYLT